MNVTLNMLLFTMLTTFLYFQQATIVDAALTDRAERTRFFANIDLAVNVTDAGDADVRHRAARCSGGACPRRWRSCRRSASPGFILLGAGADDRRC